MKAVLPIDNFEYWFLIKFSFYGNSTKVLLDRCFMDERRIFCLFWFIDFFLDGGFNLKFVLLDYLCKFCILSVPLFTVLAIFYSRISQTAKIRIEQKIRHCLFSSASDVNAMKIGPLVPNFICTIVPSNFIDPQTFCFSIVWTFDNLINVFVLNFLNHLERLMGGWRRHLFLFVTIYKNTYTVE